MADLYVVCVITVFNEPPQLATAIV